MSYINCTQCGCNCNKCYAQPLNQSNKTIVIPVAGYDAYQTWLTYNPDKDPNLNPTSPWTEKYWIDNYSSTIQVGVTANRPQNPLEGKQYFDTTINKVIYFIDNTWKDSQGVIV